MSNFTLGFKTQIINSNKQNVARFFTKTDNGYTPLGTSEDFAGDAALPASMSAILSTADRMVIDGYITLDKGSVKNAIGAKGVEKQNAEISISVATNTVDVLSQFILDLTLISHSLDSELARADSNYRRTFKYPLIAKPGDAPAAIIDRLEAALIEEAYQERPYFKVISKTANTIVISPNGVGQEIEVNATGDLITNGKVVFTPTVTKVGYLGRNNYESLKAYRPETDVTLQPLNTTDIKRQGLPIQGDLYTSITIEKSVDREELHGSTMADQDIKGTYAYEMFINQNLAQYLLAVTSWINANTAVRSHFPADTADEATANPELVNKYTVVAPAPYTAGLG